MTFTDLPFVLETGLLGCAIWVAFLQRQSMESIRAFVDCRPEFTTLAESVKAETRKFSQLVMAVSSDVAERHKAIEIRDEEQAKAIACLKADVGILFETLGKEGERIREALQYQRSAHARIDELMDEKVRDPQREDETRQEFLRHQELLQKFHSETQARLDALEAMQQTLRDEAARLALAQNSDRDGFAGDIKKAHSETQARLDALEERVAVAAGEGKGISVGDRQRQQQALALLGDVQRQQESNIVQLQEELLRSQQAIEQLEQALIESGVVAIVRPRRPAPTARSLQLVERGDAPPGVGMEDLWAPGQADLRSIEGPSELEPLPAGGQGAWPGPRGPLDPQGRSLLDLNAPPDPATVLRQLRNEGFPRFDVLRAR